MQRTRDWTAIYKPLECLCHAFEVGRRDQSLRGIGVVVERTEVAPAASGKARGFPALDWRAVTPLDVLARRSFQLHTNLPREFASDWTHSVVL
jgi:hypothetical protein